MSARQLFIVAVGAIAVYAQAQPAEKKQERWTFEPMPLKGDYQVYGGTLSEVQAPTAKDRKVSFKFTGPLAKDLFNQIGPDAKMSCGGGPDYRERNRGDLSCTYNKDDGYTCYFGLNVPTGKSTYGAIC